MNAAIQAGTTVFVATVIGAALAAVVNFTIIYLGTRAALRLARRHHEASANRQPKPPRVRRKRLRALAEAIVRAREAGVAGGVQAIDQDETDLAIHAFKASMAEVTAIVGRRRTDRIFDTKIEQQVRRILARSDRAHAAHHRYVIRTALNSMPTSLLAAVAGGLAGPVLDLGCDQHPLNPDDVVAEARRVLEARKVSGK